MSKKPSKIEITKHPDFKVVYASGVFGALKADEGLIKSYLDIVEPKIKANGKHGRMEMDKITRELQVEVRVSSTQFVNIANWMQRHIEQLQKKGILKASKKAPKGPETYRV